MKRSRGKADANQPLIDKTAEMLGAGIIKCSDCPHLGFDRIYIYKSRTYFTEIKNPAIKDPVLALTPIEKRRRDGVNAKGGFYIIVQTPTDLLDSLGIEDELAKKIEEAVKLNLDSFL